MINNRLETTQMQNSIMEILNDMNKDIKNDNLNLKPDIIVIMGDILDQHEKADSSVYCRASKFIIECAKHAPTYVLIGNHDLINNQQFLSSDHFFYQLKYSNLSIHIIDYPKIEIFYKEGFDYTFSFMPYVPPKMFSKALEYIPEWEKSNAIFAHQEFKGCKYGKMFSLKGDDWNQDYPLIISGHIHEYHKVGKNIIYVGTPFQHTFGERDNKGVSVFDFYNKNLKTDNFYVEHRYNLKIRKKILIEIDYDMINNQFNFIDDTDYKIVIKTDIHKFNIIMKHPIVCEWKKKGYKIYVKNKINSLFSEESINNKEEIKNINNIKEFKKIKPIKYSQKLYADLLESEKPELTNTFLELFGKI